MINPHQSLRYMVGISDGGGGESCQPVSPSPMLSQEDCQFALTPSVFSRGEP
jgi:hypothetical protein